VGKVANLRSLTDQNPRSLLTTILDPSAAVDGKFVTYIVLTDDGRMFTGMIASETSNSVTLVEQENKQRVILRTQVAEICSNGKSLMPDGLEKDIAHQDFADVISWADKIGCRGKDDVESPFGEWTRMEVIADGGHLLYKVNGIVVTSAFEAKPDFGKLLLQTEQAEMFVRRFELYPLGKAPTDELKQ
jgi:putative heme-binding domain-containing protein